MGAAPPSLVPHVEPHYPGFVELLPEYHLPTEAVVHIELDPVVRAVIVVVREFGIVWRHESISADLVTSVNSSQQQRGSGGRAINVAITCF